MQENGFLRLAIFLTVLLSMIAAEALLPRKKRTQARKPRWITNIGFAILDAATLRVVGSVSVMTFATFLMNNSWGLLPRLAIPYYLDIVVGVILLDLAIYGQHVISHKVPLFWRLHQVHHSDRDIDATTGVRFHPLEIIASLFYKLAVIAVIGPLAISVVAFEIILNGSAVFNHANLKLPIWLDKGLRTIIVTPDMHRVHHSVVIKETNSNYGFCLSFWDRLFKTYIAQPSAGHDGMIIGLSEWQTDSPTKLGWSLALPLKSNANNTQNA
jgi:sterol desaturase/sphingolipid hydroxylase (fatty acid hydroxylase superfamily)